MLLYGLYLGEQSIMRFERKTQGKDLRICIKKYLLNTMCIYNQTESTVLPADGG